MPVDLEKFLRAQGETLVRSGKGVSPENPRQPDRLRKQMVPAQPEQGRHVLSQNRRSQESQFIKRTQAELFRKGEGSACFFAPPAALFSSPQMLQ